MIKATQILAIKELIDDVALGMFLASEVAIAVPTVDDEHFRNNLLVERTAHLKAMKSVNLPLHEVKLVSEGKVDIYLFFGGNDVFAFRGESIIIGCPSQSNIQRRVENLKELFQDSELDHEDPMETIEVFEYPLAKKLKMNGEGVYGYDDRAFFFCSDESCKSLHSDIVGALDVFVSSIRGAFYETEGLYKVEGVDYGEPVTCDCCGGKAHEPKEL